MSFAVHSFKYIRHSVAGFIVWPFAGGELHHAHIARELEHNGDLRQAGGKILSAGFVNGVGTPAPMCYGHSESLGIAALKDDTRELRRAWGLLRDDSQAVRREWGLS